MSIQFQNAFLRKTNMGISEWILGFYLCKFALLLLQIFDFL